MSHASLESREHLTSRAEPGHAAEPQGGPPKGFVRGDEISAAGPRRGAAWRSRLAGEAPRALRTPRPALAAVPLRAPDAWELTGTQSSQEPQRFGLRRQPLEVSSTFAEEWQ